ncbi:MAG: hypothetical protein ACXVZX_12070, partial [Terriglobales bacterium]
SPKNSRWREQSHRKRPADTSFAETFTEMRRGAELLLGAANSGWTGRRKQTESERFTSLFRIFERDELIILRSTRHRDEC